MTTGLKDSEMSFHMSVPFKVYSSARLIRTGALKTFNLLKRLEVAFVYYPDRIPGRTDLGFSCCSRLDRIRWVIRVRVSGGNYRSRKGRNQLPQSLTMTSHSPSRQQNLFTRDSPVHVKSGQSIHSDHSDVQEEPRSALQDLGLSIPVIPYQTFLDHLAPPQPDFDLDSTIQSLKLGSEPVLTSSNQWTMFTNSPKNSQGSEYTIFSPIPEIFTKVVVAIIANSGGKINEDKNIVDFLQNPSRTPTSAERNKGSRPDGYLVFKDRIKVMSKGGRKEDIRWGDIALSWEYKRKGGVNELDDVRVHQGIARQANFSYQDVRKCLWSLQHMMRDDPRRRATFGLTIENCTTRVWFCCRSLLVVSEPFDCIAVRRFFV